MSENEQYTEAVYNNACYFKCGCIIIDPKIKMFCPEHGCRLTHCCKVKIRSRAEQTVLAHSIEVDLL